MPEKYKILDGSMLKLLAVVTMLLDHTALVLLRNSSPVLLSLAGHSLTVYELLIFIGRISFPLFAFLVVEGFLHTHDVKRYAVNLFLFALISEIPWNLEHSGGLFYGRQNVMFTLLLGLLGLWVIREYQEQRRKQCVLLLLLLAASVVLQADYGCSGFGFILMLYLLRDRKLYQAVVGSCFLSSLWIAGLAFVPINLYNGKRGFIDRPWKKYLFYAIYPLHMLALYLIKNATIGY